MKNNQFPQRKQIRLSGYNYSDNGYYFVTICTQNRECLFGNITDNKMILNDFGNIVKNVWNTLPQHNEVKLDTFQIMPNHIHSIIIIVGAGSSRPINNGNLFKPTLGQIIAYFKYETTKQINVGARFSRPFEAGRETRPLQNTAIQKIWQRNYFEHIIRNESELYKIREYIKLNPQMWDRDRNNPEKNF